MGTTLENGVYLPSEGERNCYAGLKTNWEILDQKVADVTALQQAVAGALHREIVESLPTTDIDPNTIYMILSGTSATENVYNEYMYVNNAWELIGTSATDLTNYYTKAEVDGKLLLKANDSDVVHKSGNETISGDKVFNNRLIKNIDVVLGTAPSTGKFSNIEIADNNKAPLLQILGGVYATGQSYAKFFIQNKTADDGTGLSPTGTLRGCGFNISLPASITSDGQGSITPRANKITDFGLSGYQWRNLWCEKLYLNGTQLDPSAFALDANVVHTNEINSSGIGIIEAVKEVGGVDFNTLTTQGLYGTNASGSTNNPENSPCVVQVIKRLNSVIQIANVSSSSYKSRYIRYCADITAQPPVWQSWIKFAIDNEVVHTSGDETINGTKTFKDMIPIDGDYLGNEASINQRTNICLRSNRDTAGKSCAYISRFRQNKSQGALQTGDLQMIGFDVLENEVRTNNVFSIQCSGWVNDVPTKVKFLSTSSESTFGSSTRPSKINDLEPSSLGMPDLDNGVDISSYITTGNTHNEYTPSVNGWISVILKSRSGALGIFLYQGDMVNSQYSSTSLPDESEPCVMASLPVKAGIVVNIDTKGSNSYVYSAKFYPCQGNV